MIWNMRREGAVGKQLNKGYIDRASIIQKITYRVHSLLLIDLACTRSPSSPFKPAWPLFSYKTLYLLNLHRTLLIVSTRVSLHLGLLGIALECQIEPDFSARLCQHQRVLVARVALEDAVHLFQRHPLCLGEAEPHPHDAGGQEHREEDIRPPSPVLKQSRGQEGDSKIVDLRAL